MNEHTTHFDDCGCKTERLTAELTELREFVGAIYSVEMVAQFQGQWDCDTFEIYHDGLLIATGTDPFDAWRKMKTKGTS